MTALAYNAILKDFLVAMGLYCILWHIHMWPDLQKPDMIARFSNSILLQSTYPNVCTVKVSASYSKSFWSYSPTK